MGVEHLTKKLLRISKGTTTDAAGAAHTEAYPSSLETSETPTPVREPETGAANDLRIAEAAKKAGLHTLPHAVAPPTEVPPTDYVG